MVLDKEDMEAWEAWGMKWCSFRCAWLLTHALSPYFQLCHRINVYTPKLWAQGNSAWWSVGQKRVLESTGGAQLHFVWINQDKYIYYQVNGNKGMGYRKMHEGQEVRREVQERVQIAGALQLGRDPRANLDLM